TVAPPVIAIIIVILAGRCGVVGGRVILNHHRVAVRVEQRPALLLGHLYGLVRVTLGRDVVRVVLDHTDTTDTDDLAVGTSGTNGDHLLTGRSLRPGLQHAAVGALTGAAWGERGHAVRVQRQAFEQHIHRQNQVRTHARILGGRGVQE